MSEPTEAVVVKLGGSLLDLPDLVQRLQHFVRGMHTNRVLFVVGGGPAADFVRQRDRLDDLGSEKSHWLAIRAMSFNSFLVEAMLPHAIVVSSLAECRAAWDAGRIPILDVHRFLMNEEAAGRSRLPRSWDVTSDTISAHVARLMGSDSLVLLKSAVWYTSDIAEAARRGIVDEHLPRELSDAPRLKVRIENLRGIPPKE